MEGYEKFWFSKGWGRGVLKDQFDITSSSIAFDESLEWQFRDVFVDRYELGSLAKHFCRGESHLCATSSAFKELWQSRGHSIHHDLHECVSLGRYSPSRGLTDSGNESKTYVSSNCHLA